MVEAQNHPFAQTLVSDFTVGDRTFQYYSLPALSDERYAKLPFSIRVLLESAVRNCDNFNVKRKYRLETLSDRRVQTYSYHTSTNSCNRLSFDSSFTAISRRHRNHP